MDRRSKHLSSEERGVILAEHCRGSSQRAIGRLLGRPASHDRPGTGAWTAGGWLLSPHGGAAGV